MQPETLRQTQPPVSPPTNPVYSEITDVSALDPVYIDIDKREPRPRSYVNVFGQGDTGAYEVPDSLPMKGQCVTRSADSVSGANDKDGVDLTKNEAYIWFDTMTIFLCTHKDHLCV